MSAALHPHAAAISSNPRQPIATVLKTPRRLRTGAPVFPAIFYFLRARFGKNGSRPGQATKASGQLRCDGASVLSSSAEPDDPATPGNAGERWIFHTFQGNDGAEWVEGMPAFLGIGSGMSRQPGHDANKV
jgi:hypothetical protein